MPAIFSDHMVLQRDVKIPVWGWAKPQGTVQVTFAGKEYTAPVEKHTGRWRLDMDPVPAGGPYEMVVVQVRTAGGIRFRDVMVGDVWLCSGQSNMEHFYKDFMRGPREDPSYHQPKIRLVQVQQATASAPQHDCHVQDGGWRTVTNAIYSPAWTFSALGYLFAEELRKSIDVPIGMIGSYWGATCAEAWMSREALASDDATKPLLAPVDQQLAKQGSQWIPDSKRTPTALYNAMIAPVKPFAIRGVVWYQGESNDNHPAQYARLFPTLIRTWRADWGREFAFLFVQLPRFRAQTDKPVEPGWSNLREAQAAALKEPNTAMAVTIDTGEADNIHPKNKPEVARRLALLARKHVYGENIVASGPVYESMTIEGNKVRIKFKDIGGGLAIQGDGPPKGFAIAGEDKTFVHAEAKLDGDTIVVWNEKVAKPVAVRYAWAYNPVVNVFNKEGFPLAPFRTDDWP